MKINIGAGDRKYEGFLNIDYDSRSNPDYVLNIEKDRLPFPDNSVTEVIAHHILEHLGEGYFHALQEIYRVCVDGALIDIRVPHPRHDTFLADPTHRRPVTPMGLWLFSKKANDATKDSPNSKLGYFYNVDFEILDSNEIPDDTYLKALEGKPIDYVKQYIHERNNIISEYHIRLVVVKNVGSK